ncbi:MAG: hypothetical protein Q8R92_13435 [Deltaproteobacteria bacterium]|nr:hypothetical protein [Deltaproteobacteria bacterium]
MHKEFRPLFFKHVMRPRLRKRFGATPDFLAALPADLSEADAHWIRSVWDDTVRIDMNHDGAIAVLRQKLERLPSFRNGGGGWVSYSRAPLTLLRSRF